MFRIQTLLLSALFVAVALIGCKQDEAQTITPDQVGTVQAPAAMQGRSGTVTETMHAAGYTYLQVEAENETFWVAAPVLEVQVGDKVSMPAGMAMTDFRSESLDRTFDVVYFVDGVRVGDAPPAAAPAVDVPPGHVRVGVQPAGDGGSIDVSGIEKAEGGYTVGELFANKADLAGEAVAVRGKVLKFNAQIMGKNWIHIQDGSGGEGANDLTISTNATAQVGDVIVVTGVLSADKDFGYGYVYSLIVEDGEVTVE